MENPSVEPFEEIINTDLIQLLAESFVFPTLSNQFMGFSLNFNHDIIEPFDSDEESIVIVNENGIVGGEPIELFNHENILNLNNSFSHPEEDQETIDDGEHNIYSDDGLSVMYDYDWDIDDYDWDYDDYDY